MRTILLILALVTASSAHAHQATELFIPIGQSPGVSGKYSVIGEIVSYDPETETVTVLTEDETTHTTRITEVTKIWIDGSATRSKSTIGKRDHLEPGVVCEVKYVYEDGVRGQDAEWIKLRAAS